MFRDQSGFEQITDNAAGQTETVSKFSAKTMMTTHEYGAKPVLMGRSDDHLILGWDSNNSSRPSSWLYRQFFTLIQCREGLSVTLYGESFRLQTIPSKSIAMICSNKSRPSLST